MVESEAIEAVTNCPLLSHYRQEVFPLLPTPPPFFFFRPDSAWP